MKKKTKFMMALFLAFLNLTFLKAQNASSAGNVPGILSANSAAFGDQSLQNSSAAATDNSAIGNSTMFNLNNGSLNTAAGRWALFLSDGNENCATGERSLYSNQTGDRNTAHGVVSLHSNSTGDENTALGSNALFVNTTGGYNSAMGYNAGPNGSTNNYQTAIGALAITNQDYMIRLGNPQITSYECEVSMTVLSDGRVKTDIREDGVKGVDFITKLRPVVYNLDTKKHTEMLVKNFSEERQQLYLNKDFSKSSAIRRTGLIAQEVEEAAKLSGYDFNAISKPKDENGTYGLAYELFVLPLVKAVQEQQALLKSYNDKLTLLSENRSQESSSIKKAEEKLKDNSGLKFEVVKNEFSDETCVNFDLPQKFDQAYVGVYNLAGNIIIKIPISTENRKVLKFPKMDAGLYYCFLVINAEITQTTLFISE